MMMLNLIDDDMRFLFLGSLLLIIACSSFSQDISYKVGQGDIVDNNAHPYLEEDFTGNLYKQVNFSELDLGVNSVQRARSFIGSNEINSTWAEDGHDSTIVLENDTVWKCLILANYGANGTQWYGKMKLNGTDYNSDTLTYARFSYYIKLSSNWDWSNGGKLLGLSADGKDNNYDGMSKGGWYPPCCEEETNYRFDGTNGFQGVGGFDGPRHNGDSTIGIYIYHHDLDWGCESTNHCKKIYGEGWYANGLKWERDKWYKITLGYKLNSVPAEGTGNYDGQITWSRNDTCYKVYNGLRLRQYSTITVDYWALKTFCGGGDDPLRTEDQYVYYDDLTLWADEDRTLPELYELETNVPKMPTPNTRSTFVDDSIEIVNDRQPPSIPSGIGLTRVTSNSLEFRWQPSTDNVGVDHYEIQLNDIYEGTTSSLNYAVADLNPNTSYTITVRAFDKAGNYSPFSIGVTRTTEAEIAVTDDQAPSTPTGLDIQVVTRQSITLSWNPSTDNVAVTAYKIYVNNDPKVESLNNSTTIEGLTAGLTYSISVSALDQVGNESGNSQALEVVTINDDFTTNPTLPEVNIVDLQNKSDHAGSLSEVKSLGHAEVNSYGIMVTMGNQSPDEGDPIFAEKSLTEVESKGRITDGLQLLYNFSDKDGSRVSEISGVGEPLDLHINHPLNTTWLPGQGLKVDGNTTLLYEGNPSRLRDALANTNEITMEAWISQCETKQTGPARILNLSSGGSTRAFTLGHEGNETSYNYNIRLNTTNTDLNGLPEFVTSTDFTSESLHHVVYTRDKTGIEKLYVNGIQLSSGVRLGDFSSWDEDYRIALGNELDGEKAWIGTFYLVAVYNQALSEEDVYQNYESGFGKIRYTTNLSDLKPNTTYKLYPFVRTDQGIVYGEKKSFLIENVLFSEEEDSLYMAVYPNPSNGDFKLHVEYENSISQPAYLRLADMSGQVIYGQELRFNDEYVNIEIDINLATQISEGIYSAILIVGTIAVAQKLVIHP